MIENVFVVSLIAASIIGDLNQKRIQSAFVPFLEFLNHRDESSPDDLQQR